MSPKEFKKNWNAPAEPLRQISGNRLAAFNLHDDTRIFLAFAGLPAYAAPYLSFSEDSDDEVYGINNLVDIFETDETDGDRNDPGKYVVIGSCRDGDLIAIKTTEGDKIFELDHEDHFTPAYFNVSIEALADFLIIYRDFEHAVIAAHGEEKHRNGYFTDEQFEELKAKMNTVDPDALTEDGFWKDQLEIKYSLRKEYLREQS
ncbi:SUKH-4 family immunity protein [Chitinophaga sp. S165]|uniref:SUKH-4 family immunity protein n=1 Tax=Chitinophaga sp. S165 TaxID=2135462 RepID=UPI000D71AA9E|nr:SUKH-4 family immunity protein [Chitinophaga sp. S165]PWV49126.1 SUKH-4 immunity protein of toxin-antitoxin system [Chitinophaga sp. S165]